MPVTIDPRTRAQCCDQTERDPDVPANLILDGSSHEIFRSAPIGCSFTGAVHIPTHRIYLHPLVATRDGNAHLGSKPNLLFSSKAGDLAGNITSILHPNMTPELRVQRGLSSGHDQICAKFGLNKEHCVGFAIAKGLHEHTMTTSSQTLNSSKFKFLSQVDLANLISHKPMVRRFGEQQLVNKLGTGHMSKEWADLIARTLGIYLPIGHRTPQGSYESPY